jgi:hypothetical protein
MLRIAAKLARSGFVATLLVSSPFVTLVWRATADQNPHAGPVTGIIDGVVFEGGFCRRAATEFNILTPPSACRHSDSWVSFRSQPNHF